MPKKFTLNTSVANSYIQSSSRKARGSLKSTKLGGLLQNEDQLRTVAKPRRFGPISILNRAKTGLSLGMDYSELDCSQELEISKNGTYSSARDLSKIEMDPSTKQQWEKLQSHQIDAFLTRFWPSSSEDKTAELCLDCGREIDHEHGHDCTWHIKTSVITQVKPLNCCNQI